MTRIGTVAGPCELNKHISTPNFHVVTYDLFLKCTSHVCESNVLGQNDTGDIRTMLEDARIVSTSSHHAAIGDFYALQLGWRSTSSQLLHRSASGR